MPRHEEPAIDVLDLKCVVTLRSHVRGVAANKWIAHIID